MKNRDTVEPFWDRETLAECVGSDRVEPQRFARRLEDFLGGGHVFLTASGRGALRRFLASTLPRSSTVLACSFNCWVVAEAALGVGHAVETFDLASPRGGIDWGQVASRLRRRHGAVVVPHFFGAPTDFRQLLDAAKATGTLIVEDCAHALGAKVGGRMVGTLADAAIFSFNYDKPISLAGGGALLVNNEQLLDHFDAAPSAPSFDQEVREVSRYLRAANRSRAWIRHADGPWRYLQRALRVARWLPRALPTTTRGIGPLRAALGCWQLARYGEIVRRRNDNAAYVGRGLEGIAWPVEAGTTPAWLRQKFILPGRDVARIERQLRRRGLRVGRWNWRQTLEHRLGGTPPVHAAHVAAHGIDVPIHQNMTRADLDEIRSAVLSSMDPALARAA